MHLYDYSYFKLIYISLSCIINISSYKISITKGFVFKRSSIINKRYIPSLMYSDINNLIFVNQNLKNLPIDLNINSKQSRQVSNAIFSIAEPTPVINPQLIIKSNKALNLLNLSCDIPNKAISEYFSGNKIIPGSQPTAHCYCGYQFGNFAGQLGDGATMYLGEIINPNTNLKWELQLKGAGKTPYSRNSDGRKVLRSSVREFLCSEAMHALQIPTTRAGTCVTSSSTVVRDPLYNGNEIQERCTIISRIAINFFRFGSFEIFKPKDNISDRAGPSAGNENLKKQLLDHIINYFPELNNKLNITSIEEIYQQFFLEVIKRTSELVALWQTYGFVHGVLNTDNMSIMGLTIDYGPFGFLEAFDKDFVPNGSDNSARYAYEKQPSVCKWNLEKLAESLHPLLDKSISLKLVEDHYDYMYHKKYHELMFNKLGLIEYKQEILKNNNMNEMLLLITNDELLMNDFFQILEQTNTDYTDAFTALTMYIEEISIHNINNNDTPTTTTTTTRSSSTSMIDNEKNQEAFRNLIARLVSRSATPKALIEQSRRKIKIHRLNMHPGEIEQLWNILETQSPKEIENLFNGAPADAIRVEISGEKRKLDILMKSALVIKNYEMISVESKQSIDRNLWIAWCEKYQKRILSSYDIMIKHNNINTNSSINIKDIHNHRIITMQSNNPSIILRNWLAQDAITKAEKYEDYTGIEVLYEMLQQPYNIEYRSWKTSSTNNNGKLTTSTNYESMKDMNEKKLYLQELYTSTAPDWADSLICTCSS